MILVYYSACKNFQKSRHDTAWRLLEYVISKNFGEDIKTLKLTEEPQGKPYFEDRPDISFNLSHSGEYAVCAMRTDGKPIGVDIEEIRPIPARVKNRYLGGYCDETEAIRRWTRRESYGKFTGEGLKAPCPDEIMKNEPGSDAALPNGFCFTEYRIGKYMITVCTENLSHSEKFPDNSPGIEFIEVENSALPAPIFGVI